MQDSFVFYRSFWDALEKMDADDLRATMIALCSLALDDAETELKGIPEIVMTLIKPQVIANKKRRVDGKRGGRPKENKPAVIECATNEKPVVKGLHTDCKPNANANVNANVNVNENENEKHIPPPNGGKSQSRKESQFNEFWSAYPKKRSKGSAKKVWDKLHPSADLVATMLKSISDAKKSTEWQKSNGDYIPHPAKWLNATGWEDEMDVENAVNTQHISVKPYDEKGVNVWE